MSMTERRVSRVSEEGMTPTSSARSATYVTRFRRMSRTLAFKAAMYAGTITGIISAIVYYFDSWLEHHFLEAWVPSETIFSVFITFCSLVAAFRTAHALSRYMDGAMYVHKLSACWFDACSLLVTFCRMSSVEASQVDQFQQTLIRLMSLLNGLCLDNLRNDSFFRSMGNTSTLTIDNFEFLGFGDLDSNSKEGILQAQHKVEYVFQLVQQLVTDNMKTGVLVVPPPILTRAYHEMGNGLTTFHEAKKLAQCPLPYAFSFITMAILISEACLVPFMVALYTKGFVSAFVFTFTATFLIWFMNGVDDALDNPYHAEAQSLDLQGIQVDLNELLSQMMHNRLLATPTVPAESEAGDAKLPRLSRSMDSSEVDLDGGRKSAPSPEVAEPIFDEVPTPPRERAEAHGAAHPHLAAFVARNGRAPGAASLADAPWAEAPRIQPGMRPVLQLQAVHAQAPPGGTSSPSAGGSCGGSGGGLLPAARLVAQQASAGDRRRSTASSGDGASTGSAARRAAAASDAVGDPPVQST